MNFTEIIEKLNEASLFELYRLNVAINNELENPERLDAVRKGLKIGQRIKYFDFQKNKLIPAKIIEFKRTRILIENETDGKRWNIPIYSINTEDIKVDIKSTKKTVHKNKLKIGDKVSFRDKNNQEQFGEVIGLNQKTANLLVNNTKWRVSYNLLSSVIDVDSVNENIIEIEEIK